MSWVGEDVYILMGILVEMCTYMASRNEGNDSYIFAESQTCSSCSARFQSWPSPALVTSRIKIMCDMDSVSPWSFAIILAELTMFLICGSLPVFVCC